VTADAVQFFPPCLRHPRRLWRYWARSLPLTCPAGRTGRQTGSANAVRWAPEYTAASCPQDPGPRQLGVVVKDRPRHLAEEAEGRIGARAGDGPLFRVYRLPRPGPTAYRVRAYRKN